jgi:hypothetical protein
MNSTSSVRALRYSLALSGMKPPRMACMLSEMKQHWNNLTNTESKVYDDKENTIPLFYFLNGIFNTL